MVRLEVKRARVDEALESLAGNVREEMNRELRGFGARWERTVKQGFAAGGREARGGRRLRARTGALRRSVRFRLEPRRHAVALLVGNKSTPYARLQEEGGVVRPVRRRWLTVPLTPALTGSGALSGAYRIRPAGTRNGRPVFTTDKGETFIYKSRRGNLLVGLKRKGRKKFDPKRDTLYVLKKRTEVPPRLGAWNAARLDGPNGRRSLKGFYKAADRGIDKS